MSVLNSTPKSSSVAKPGTTRSASPTRAVSESMADGHTRAQLLANTSSRALVLTLGVRGGIGKSLLADCVKAYCMTSQIPTAMIRLESGARRKEFPGDEFIDLDLFAAAEKVGGAAAYFANSWALIEATFNKDGVAVMDCGANSHRRILRLATLTGLSRLVAKRGGRTFAMVVTERDADLVRQSVDLVADLRERMPEAEIIIAMNERADAFVDDGTPEGRAYRDELVPLLKQYAHVRMPLAEDRSLAAFAASHRSFPAILAATDEELQQWSGQPLLSALACQTGVGAFWLALMDELRRVLPFPGSQ
jgi:hypothetical protein